MISRHIDLVCSEDPSLIENYDKAINDQTQMWECHHRLETDLNVSAQYLKEHNLYLNRPASELIFLTKSEHQKLHTRWNVGVSPKEETRKKVSLSLKGKLAGEKHPFYGKSTWNKGIPHKKETCQKITEYQLGSKFMSNGIECHRVHRDKIEYYLSLGYHFGRK